MRNKSTIPTVMLCVLIIVIAIFLGVVMGTLFSDQKEIKEMEKVEGVGGV